MILTLTRSDHAQADRTQSDSLRRIWLRTVYQNNAFLKGFFLFCGIFQVRLVDNSGFKIYKNLLGSSGKILRKLRSFGKVKRHNFHIKKCVVLADHNLRTNNIHEKNPFGKFGKNFEKIMKLFNLTAQVSTDLKLHNKGLEQIPNDKGWCGHSQS